MEEREAMDEEVCGPRNHRQRLGYQPEMKEPPRRGRTERVTENERNCSEGTELPILGNKPTAAAWLDSQGIYKKTG